MTEYLDDFDKQLVVERLLQLIFQGAIDINRYLLKELGVDQARYTNFEIFIEMGKCGIISP
ncbi:HepT-like ribonuclease domain-containing protein [Hydrocoleum sp. CS-953]|uniref:HepT-like ribonuclease domain-containing protein n=1 Tax=Hydrocoleum sp. CS-953 TaxID=1671698 RepID=UPI000B9ADDFD|nr:HepT-like ribonuclease domain-containing protein [Hydrocoleum sp. CS-953]